jgi:hypothetical protein
LPPAAGIDANDRHVHSFEAYQAISARKNPPQAWSEAGEWRAIKFVFSTKGKVRGYTEKLEVKHGEIPKPIIMQMNLGLDGDE